MSSATTNTTHFTNGAVPPELVDAIDAALVDCETNVAFGLKKQGTESELLLHDLPHGSPGSLVGFVAPDDWVAFGIGARGRARWAETAGHEDAAESSVSESRIVFLADREGNTASRLRLEGTCVHEPGETIGPLADLTLRVLQLPTSAPERSTMYLWAVLWLDRIVADFAAAARPPNWHQLTHRCPGIDAAHEVFGTRPTTEEIAKLGRVLGAGFGWETLRNLQAEGRGLFPEPSPAVAEWMDVGMFARSTLSFLPELDDLIDAVESLAGRGARTALTDVLSAWEVMPR